MTEEEYCNLSDFQRLRSIVAMLDQLYCYEERDIGKVKEARELLYQITEKLEPIISGYRDNE